MIQFEDGEVEVQELATSNSPGVGKKDTGVGTNNLSTPEKLFLNKQKKRREIFLISPGTVPLCLVIM